MNVTLARALKEKNRIAGRLRKAQELVVQENRKAAGSPRTVDVAATLAEVERLSALLTTVKSAIAAANNGIVATIIELEETKSLLSFLSSVNTSEEIELEHDFRGTIERRWDVVLRAPDILAKTTAVQQHADALQDRIDEYNAVTRIDLPDGA